MRTTILRVSTAKYQEFADISNPGTLDYARRCGVGFSVCWDVDFEDPYMERVARLRGCLESWDRVVLADSDVMFNPGCSDIDALFAGPVSVHVDGNGINTSLVACRSEPAVLRLLDTWLALGSCDIGSRMHWHDQAALMVMDENFRWVHDLIHRLPGGIVGHRQTRPGRVAHHFGHADDGVGRMRAVDWGSDQPTG